MSTHPEIEGREFDWFATDCAGNVAILATTGSGPVPASVISSCVEHGAISDSIDSSHWGSEAVWDDFAKLGLFVYDWELHGGPYRRMREPTAEVADQLREKLRGLTSMPRLNLQFMESKAITLDALSNFI